MPLRPELAAATARAASNPMRAVSAAILANGASAIASGGIATTSRPAGSPTPAAPKMQYGERRQSHCQRRLQHNTASGTNANAGGDGSANIAIGVSSNATGAGSSNIAIAGTPTRAALTFNTSVGAFSVATGKNPGRLRLPGKRDLRQFLCLWRRRHDDRRERVHVRHRDQYLHPAWVTSAANLRRRAAIQHRHRRCRRPSRRLELHHSGRRDVLR